MYTYDTAPTARPAASKTLCFQARRWELSHLDVPPKALLNVLFSFPVYALYLFLLFPLLGHYPHYCKLSKTSGCQSLESTELYPTLPPPQIRYSFTSMTTPIAPFLALCLPLRETSRSLKVYRHVYSIFQTTVIPWFLLFIWKFIWLLQFIWNIRFIWNFSVYTYR